MKFERKSGFLRLNGIHMTEGNYNDLVEIQSNWIKIIKNEDILSSYLELNKIISEIKKNH